MMTLTTEQIALLRQVVPAGAAGLAGVTDHATVRSLQAIGLVDCRLIDGQYCVVAYRQAAMALVRATLTPELAALVAEEGL